MCFCAQNMNNAWGLWVLSVCVHVNVKQSDHFAVWMCPGFICIWRWVHSGGWIPRDLFSNLEPRDARTSAFCLTQSANPLMSPAKSRWLLCFPSSRLLSRFLFLSRRLSQFLFTSPFSFSQAGKNDALSCTYFVCFEWSLNRSQLGSSLFAVSFSLSFKHVHIGPIYPQQGPRKL